MNTDTGCKYGQTDRYEETDISKETLTYVDRFYIQSKYIESYFYILLQKEKKINERLNED